MPPKPQPFHGLAKNKRRIYQEDSQNKRGVAKTEGKSQQINYEAPIPGREVRQTGGLSQFLPVAAQSTVGYLSQAKEIHTARRLRRVFKRVSGVERSIRGILAIPKTSHVLSILSMSSF